MKPLHVAIKISLTYLLKVDWYAYRGATTLKKDNAPKRLTPFGWCGKSLAYKYPKKTYLTIESDANSILIAHESREEFLNKFSHWLYNVGWDQMTWKLSLFNGYSLILHHTTLKIK